MSQDIIADALNQVINAKKANKNSVNIKRYSKFLLNILTIGKIKGYIEDYKIEENELDVKFGKINYCKAVKPRFIVKVKDIEKYVRRYLPSRNMGTVIISTSKGLMTHQTAMEKKIGGSVVAYFY